MEWGVALNVVESVETTVANSVRLERAGIASVWITDFPAIRSASPLAAAVAEMTNSCRIGIGLLSPDLYGPNHIIQQVETLVDHFGKRFDVLIGPGDGPALERIGVDRGVGAAVVKRTLKAATQIRTQLKDSNCECRIFLGAQGPMMIEASSSFDGVLLNYSDEEMIEWSLKKLKRNTQDFVIGVFPPTCLEPNPDFDSSESIRRAAAMVALGLTRSVWDEFGLESSLRAGQRALRESGSLDDAVIDVIGNETLHRFSVYMSVSELCEYIEDLQRRGINLVVFGPPLCKEPSGIDQIIEARYLCGT